MKNSKWNILLPVLLLNSETVSRVIPDDLNRSMQLCQQQASQLKILPELHFPNDCCLFYWL